ncbi:MAG: SRPBCC family protein [Bryobacteraceae bacterium]|nr:SRPBCC family protein [Bryobacteraceae bacterium]
MRHFSVELDVAAPRRRVWSVMTDFGGWPDWTPSVTGIEPLDAGPAGAGKRYRLRQPGFPAAVWEITAYQPERGFEWVTRRPGTTVFARHRLEENGRGGTRVTLAVEFTGPFGGMVGWLMRGVNERFLGMEARGLKERVER